jgi:ribosome-binding factor A
MTSIRQNKAARLIQRELSEYFRKRNWGKGTLISVTMVRITPDLGLAKCYLSLFNVPEPEEMLETIREKSGEIRGELGFAIKNQVRHVPQLHFYIDDSLDYAEQINDLLKQ